MYIKELLGKSYLDNDIIIKVIVPYKDEDDTLNKVIFEGTMEDIHNLSYGLNNHLMNKLINYFNIKENTLVILTH